MSTDACLSCPPDTFRDGWGATAFSDCSECPEGASTERLSGRTKLDTCKCNERLYSTSSGSGWACELCPTGGICLETGSCAFNLVNRGKRCTVVGEWQRSTREETLGKIQLLGCPVGHVLVNESHDVQRCEKCQQDEFVSDSWDPEATCQKCPASAICPNGGPPIFDRSFVQSSVSIDCDPNDVDAVKESLAASLGIDPSKMILDSIDTGAAATRRSSPHESLPEGFTLRNSGSRRAQAVPLTISYRVFADAAAIEEIKSKLAQGDTLRSALSSQLEMRGVPAVVNELGTPESMTVKAREGEVWEEIDGVFKLQACAPGFLLVNTTDSTQECKECDAGKYAVDFAMGCGALRCDSRNCIECPSGADCEKGSDEAWKHFVPRPLTLGGHVLPEASVFLRGEVRHMSCDEQGCQLLGLKWERMDASELQSRVEIVNPALSFALGENAARVFTKKELDFFELAEVFFNSYIDVGNNTYFKPHGSSTQLPSGSSIQVAGGAPHTSQYVWRYLQIGSLLCGDGARESCFVLESCPPGHQLFNKTDDGLFSAAQQKCKPCGAGYYIIDQVHPCKPCPKFAYCPDGSTFLSKTLAPGFQWDFDNEKPVFEWEVENDFNSGGLRRRILSCPLGWELRRVPDDPDQDDCVQCPAGSYLARQIRWEGSTEDLGKCLPCPAGLRCVAGTHEAPLIEGSEWRLEGDHMRVVRCPPGYVILRDEGDRSEIDQCLECPPRYYSSEWAEYSDDGALVVRKEVEATNGRCLPCPEGSICDGGAHIVPKKNWWKGTAMWCQFKANSSKDGELEVDECRDSQEEWLAPVSLSERRGTEGVGNVTHIRVVEQVYKCPPKVCGEELNNMTTNRCRTGHTGVACASCLPGFAMRKGQCVSCMPVSEGDDASRQVGTAVIMYVWPVIIGSILMGVWYYLAWKPFFEFAWMSGRDESCFKASLAIFKFAVPAKYTKIFNIFDVFKKSDGLDSSFLRGILKIVTGFLQILGSFINSFDVEWPRIFERIWEITALFQIDFMSIPNAACMLDSFSYFNLLQFTTLLPVAAVFFLAMPTGIAATIGYFKYGSPSRYPNWIQISAKLQSSTMLVLFLVYPSTSGAVLRALNCRKYGVDGRFLIDDHTIDCDSDAYRPIFIWALVCVFIYPLGVPALMYFQMKDAGLPEMAQEKEMSSRFTGLLRFRQMQLTTMARAIIAQTVGNTRGDDDELQRRLQLLHEKYDLKALFHEGHPDNPNMRTRDLLKAVSLFGEIPKENVPVGDIQDLIRQFDPHHSGLDHEEFCEMVQEICEVNMRFTGFEKLEELSMTQLHALKAHDWSKAVQEIWKVHRVCNFTRTSCPLPSCSNPF